MSDSNHRSNVSGLNSYAAFEELRKTNPGLYWKGSTQAMLHRKANEMGEKFFLDQSQPRNPDNGQFASLALTSGWAGEQHFDRAERIAALERQLSELKEGDSNDQ